MSCHDIQGPGGEAISILADGSSIIVKSCREFLSQCMELKTADAC